MSVITIPFKGIRYKGVHTPALEYQLNNVVSHPETGVKYIAYAFDVPANISITDTAYWKFYDDGDVLLSSQVSANTLAISGMIDSGSNANGTWVKFSDGTYIASAALDGQGKTFTNGTYARWFYPFAFHRTPVITITMSRNATDSIGIYARIDGLRTDATSAVFGHSATATTGCTFMITVIGRWKE